jgi:outer membrane PBP1 activator LpoA protein
MAIFPQRAGYFPLLVRLAIILGGLAACAPSSKGPPKIPSATARAETLADQGHYLAAAAEYVRLAAAAQPPQRQDYQLQAVATLLQGNQLQKAQEILVKIAPESLDPALSLRYRLLTAQLALAEREAKQALALLRNIEDLEPSLEQQATIYRVRTKAYELEGDLLAAIRERVQGGSILVDTQALEENQRALWHSLVSLPPDTLKTWRNEPLSDTLRGWVVLAQIFQRYQLNPADLQQAIDNWQKHYPGHPASLPLLQAEMSTSPTAAPYQPAIIALLLPTKERFAAAAKAVRDGFFAAYYNDNSNWNPIIRFYAVTTDSKTGKSNVRSIYQQAQKEGAEFVVGPLTKQSLASLAELSDLPVPTLALNYLESSHQPEGKLYQFALSPEDEARGVAERAWRDGHSNALALIPNSKWGQRIREALTERWQQLGGKLLKLQVYDPEKEDYSLLIQRLLNLDEDKSRHPEELHEQLDRKAAFEPLQHHDADVIFLTAFPQQARLLIPQLRFYRAEKLPVYSSSHVYAGYPDPDRDLDLDGVIFSDIPWLLDKNAQHDSNYQSLVASHPENFERLKRLYALGCDAYRIIPYLNALHQIQGMTFEGATGKLRMDAEQRLQRELIWARFKEGQPQPITAQ